MSETISCLALEVCDVFHDTPNDRGMFPKAKVCASLLLRCMSLVMALSVVRSISPIWSLSEHRGHRSALPRVGSVAFDPLSAAVEVNHPDKLLNHLVGDREHVLRHLDAERPRRLQVDGEIELGCLQHRQVGGLGALEDFAGIDADLTE
jgi:hypothetical protein